MSPRQKSSFYTPPPEIPREWIDLLLRLHPITAIVVYEVLTHTLSAATMDLAKYSPDWDRFTLVRAVGGGNADLADMVCDEAAGFLDEVFDLVLPGRSTRRVLH